MRNALAHCEAGAGMRPRHPVVCIIDAIGILITLELLATSQLTLLTAILPVALLPLFAISIVYHLAPKERLAAKH